MHRRGRTGNWLIGAIGFYLVVVTMVVVVDYLWHREHMLAEIDNRLRIVAAGVRHVLADDFHDRATSPDSITPAEDRSNRDALTAYAEATGVRYVWTDIALEGRFFLTACNRTEQTNRPGLAVDYFVEYESLGPAERAAFLADEPVFATHSDKWGNFRAVFAPQRSPGGRLYLAGAEYETAAIERELVLSTVRTIISTAVLLLAVFPLGWVFIRMSRQHTATLAAANRDLEAGRQHVAAILDSLDDAVIATNRAGRITRVNPVAVELLGWSANEALGQPLDDVVSLADPDSGAPLDGLFARVRDENVPVRLMTDVAVRTRHGAEVTVDAGIVHGLRGAGLVAVLRDVTERRRLEAQLRQAQKLETVGRLAGGIAHDFNNLLMAIMGSAELVASTLADREDLRPDIERILKAGRRAAELTRQLLVFSRQQPAVKAVVDLHEIIREMAVLLEHSLDRRIELDIHLDAANSNVIADQSRLGSVLMNLAINARDAMADGGTLALRTRNCRDDGLVDGDELVQLEVEDTGVGMAPEVLEHIFEPFFTTKDVGRGTGLGMAVVYATVRDMGGSIEVDSEVGRGARFRVLLPVTTDHVAGEHVAVEELSETILSGRRILLVEDEADLRHLARRVLGSHGCEVETAGDGMEAETVFRRDPARFDAVILDLVMPRRDGVATFSVLRNLAPEMPVLLCSGFDATHQVMRILAEVRTGFLAKPYSRIELVAALNDLLENGNDGIDTT